MKVLVTGGAGFIGTHLVNRLIQDGHDVVVLDSLATGKQSNVNKAVKFIKGDITNYEDIVRAIDGCAAVFHLAAVAEVVASDEDGVYRTNFIGSRNVFEAAKAKKVKVIFASSAAVYGDIKPPHREDMECKPISMYGKTKYKAEKLAPEGSFILLLFNVYGPGGHGAVNRFCKLIPEYDEITIYGTGMQTRDYVYVTDVVDAMMLGMTHKGLYNVGTAREISVLTLIDTIFSITRNKPATKFAMPRSGETARSCADISKIRELGWQPKVYITQGLKMLLADKS